jgi:CheY-like chemotaxis protein
MVHEDVRSGGWAIATLVDQSEQHIAAKPDRRRRMRTKMGLHVRMEGGRGTLQAFEDVGKTIDVSRHGLLVATSMGGYWVGQSLQVTCPFWSTPVAINTPRKAKVVRTILLPNCTHAVAVEFQDGIPDGGDHALLSSPFADQVRVLGVESDPRMASAATALLTQDGYHVLFVSTTQQALDILKNETPSVIIAEAEGGEVSGHDLCAIVKTSQRLQHVPVILMTRSAMPSDYSAGHRLGAMLCMAKPCKPARLQQAVHLVAAPPSAQSVYSARFNMGAFVRTC